MAARGSFSAPSRLPALFLTLQRNREYWASQPLLAAGARISFPGSELVYQLYPGPRAADPVARDVRQAQRLLERRQALRRARRRAARRGAAAGHRARGRARVGVPVPVRRPEPAVGLLARPGHRACRRWRASATRLQRQAEVFPIALRGLGIFETAPPAGVRVPAGDGAHYLQYSGLPRLFIINGFVQSLVGLYDFAALTGDATARSLFDAGDLAARTEVPTFDTGAWSLYSRAARARTSPTSATTRCCATSSTQLCKRTATIAVLQRRAALHPVPDDRRRRSQVLAAHAARPRSPASCASSSRRSRASTSRSGAATRSWRRSTRACSGAGRKTHRLDRAEADGRLHGDGDRHRSGRQRGNRVRWGDGPEAPVDMDGSCGRGRSSTRARAASGKTSVAAATARRCAAGGARTLVLSTDPAHSLADALQAEVGGEPTRGRRAACRPSRCRRRTSSSATGARSRSGSAAC